MISLRWFDKASHHRHLSSLPWQKKQHWAKFFWILQSVPANHHSTDVPYSSIITPEVCKQPAQPAYQNLGVMSNPTLTETHEVFLPEKIKKKEGRHDVHFQIMW